MSWQPSYPGSAEKIHLRWSAGKPMTTVFLWFFEPQAPYAFCQRGVVLCDVLVRFSFVWIAFNRGWEQRIALDILFPRLSFLNTRQMSGNGFPETMKTENHRTSRPFPAKSLFGKTTTLTFMFSTVIISLSKWTNNTCQVDDVLNFLRAKQARTDGVEVLVVLKSRKHDFSPCPGCGKLQAEWTVLALDWPVYATDK